MNQAGGLGVGTRELTFTPAELGFLAGLSGASQTIVDEILGGEPLNEVMQVSVIGGLVIRQWLSVEGEELHVDDALNGVAGVMSQADRAIMLGILNDGAAASAMIFFSQALTIVAMSRGTGVFELSAMRSRDDAGAFVQALLRGAVSRDLTATSVREIRGDAVREFAATRIDAGWAVAEQADPDSAVLAAGASDAVERLLSLISLDGAELGPGIA
jgi:hypothetical protein